MAVITPFFKAEELPVARRTGKNGVRHASASGGCEACKLYMDCHTPKMPATGDGRKGILVLAEAPGANEDEQGVQLVGKSGRRLRRELERVGIDLDTDCRKLNAVNCRPPKNRTPTDREIACCRHRVMAEIEEYKPRVILALGGPAMKSLCQHRALWEAGFPTATNWQGSAIPDQDLSAWILPTWHPAFLERLNGHPVFERKFREDISKVAEYIDRPAPQKQDYESMIEIHIDPNRAASALAELYRELRQADNPLISFDYETTGLKPYIDGHKIVCCSIAWRNDRCMSFLTTPETWPILARILRDPNIGKAAHNMKFEQLWSMVRGWPEHGGFAVRNWEWDSMLASHVLDNRTGRHGLKLQAYLHFGILGYDNAISHYLKGNKKSKNAINNVEHAPLRDILLYCGYDSLLEHQLAVRQMKQVQELGLERAYSLLHNGALALVDAERNGIVIDLAYCAKQKAHLDRQIEHAKKKIMQYPEVQTWQRKVGSSFNLGSSTQLAWLLHKELGLPIVKQTTSGAASVDKATLEDIDLPFVQDLLHIRKLEKLRTTYLEAYLNEAPDGWLHPFYHLHKVISYRGSCSDPNFQNIPKRDSMAQKVVRRALLPRPGYCWFEVDYSGLEVRIAATYHKDPEMIRYLNDPSSDMHRDTAMDLCFLEKDQVSKYLRQSAKNGFVFAQFYGDWYKACAENLWHKWFNSPDALLADGKTHIKTHLAKHGIKNLEKFINHVKHVEEHFWFDRFPVYNQWREDQWETYRRKGYFWGHTGFRYTAIMDRNDVINYGTQGSGFHCLLWSMTEINRILKSERWKSLLIGQIHDAIDGNAHPDEINDLVGMIRGVMIDKLCQQFDWINVPLDVEFDMAPLGKSWYEMKTLSKRPAPCACGLEWGYAKKQQDDSLRWDCPVCEHFDVFRRN